ncbi:MAG: GNAT family N-acetyltransferase [Bacteroidetes bacterium]|nr:GNAT family N-acetyltransferase [Bacteroidota bacterium]
MINWSGFTPVGKEQEYLLDAFNSGWISGGGYVQQLEQSLESIFTGAKAYTVSNGTVALQLAYQAMEVSVGDEVIIPSFCFQAASNVALQLGLVPVFCDVDRKSFNQSVESIAHARTEKTIGIVVVHNYGVSAPIEEICSWAKQNGLWVIEDCAEAWFSKYNDKYLGTFGDIATFSMHATKTIACGEGGVVLVNNQSLFERIALLRSHGLNRSGKQYYHLLPGNNYRLSNLLCAVALAQIEERKRILQSQRQSGDLYRTLLTDHSAIEFQKSLDQAYDETWANALFIHFDRLSITRDGLIALLASNGVESRPGFYSARALPFYAANATIHSENADFLAQNIVVLPTNGSVGEDSVREICNTLLTILSRHNRAKSDCRFSDVLDSADWKADLLGLLTCLESGQTQFRYFANRSLEVVKTHKKTILLKDDEGTIAYGHLEVEGRRLWLGIAVVDDRVGQGWGKFMMQKLLSEAEVFDFDRVSLRVDNENLAAINLYKGLGFAVVLESGQSSSLLMEKVLPKQAII